MTTELQLLSMPYVEAQRLHQAAARGDEEAVKFFEELWPEAGECFLCGDPLAAFEGVTAIMTDPRGKSGDAMLGRQCDRCGGLTYQERLHRLNKLFKLMFRGWRPVRPGWRT